MYSLKLTKTKRLVLAIAAGLLASQAVSPAAAASVNGDLAIAQPQHHHHHHHSDSNELSLDSTTILLDRDEAAEPVNETIFDEYPALHEFTLQKRSSVFSGDPFAVAISTASPPSAFSRITHPLQPFESNSGQPIPTNKFYTNLLLGTRANPAYTQPYAIWQATTGSYLGMAISHTTKSQFVYGPNASLATTEYYFSPAGIMSIVFGAKEFSAASTFNLSINTPTDLAVNAVLTRSTGTGTITMPLVIGMGMVTAIYNQVTPSIMSAVGFKSFSQLTAPQSNMLKYELTLNNGVKWLMYVKIPSGATTPKFSLSGGYTFISNTVASNYLIQVAVEPSTSSIATYDTVAGRYLTGGAMTGTISNNGYTGVYRIQYTAAGTSTNGKPLVFAAPHHVAAFTSQMNAKITSIQLDSPNMGLLTGVISTQLEMTETLPMAIGFLPYSQVSGRTGGGLTSAMKTTITNAIIAELAEDIAAQGNVASTYYSGKALDKFAQIVFTSKYILGNNSLALTGLAKLKTVFNKFASNTQTTPLAYDTTWKGIVSTLGITNNDATADFGATYYNDHHFHYGYLIHAAAVIAQVDNDIGGGTWLATYKSVVNSWVRDVANPTTSDSYFPVWRSFDWYAGHSWAKGLFESADGKDEESSSEDVHFAYAMKLWGRVIGDSAMEARGNLMLAVLKRSLNSYFLYLSSNTIMPAKLLGNKVSGILFENKVDHTTYFGTDVQYTQGIHMIPITSVSSYIRSPAFVTEEWNSLLSSIVSSLTDGWRGILMMNRALNSPSTSLSFFSGSSYSSAYLDSGMSLTWALAYAAYTV